jgi:transcriptional regulator with XRE-family HTH domain
MNMEDIKLAFGLRVKELRLEKGLSQEKLANIAGVDRTYMTQVENGKRNLTIIKIKQICKGLDVSLSDFFNSDYFIEEV